MAKPAQTYGTKVQYTPVRMKGINRGHEMARGPEC
jgi:hypothetical protein